jgi:hypothetical protein
MLIDAVACLEAGAAGPGGSFAGFTAWEVVPQYPELAGFGPILRLCRGLHFTISSRILSQAARSLSARD